MRNHVLALGLLWLPAAAAARADVLVAVRPGVMCTSAEALARLTLPDGSSRTAVAAPEPRHVALKAAGGCVDIPRGARVAVNRSYRNTSIGTHDPGDGRGLREFVVPNIDFRPLPNSGDRFRSSGRAMAPPSEPDTADFLFSALEQACPEKNWRGAGTGALRGPLEAARAEAPLARVGPPGDGSGRRCLDGGAGCSVEATIAAMLRADQLGRLLRAYCAADPG